MNFGNYSIITKKDAVTIINDPTIVYSFSGTLKTKYQSLVILIV